MATSLFTEEVCIDLVEKLAKNGVEVLTLEKFGNCYRIVTFSTVIVLTEDNRLILSPTQFSCVTPKAISNGLKINFTILSIFMDLGVSSVEYPMFPNWINLSKEGEYLGITEGEEAVELISKEMVKMNYDPETLKQLADNAIETRLQKKVESKATQIMKNPAFQMVDYAGNPLTNDGAPPKIIM